MSEPTAYAICRGEYDEREVVWITLDNAVADAAVAEDGDLWVDDAPLIDSLPNHATVHVRNAALNEGALVETETSVHQWSPARDVQVKATGPSRKYGTRTPSWSFDLTVSGSDEAEVARIYSEALDDLLRATARPPKMRQTEALPSGRLLEAAAILGVDPEDLTSAYVGEDQNGIVLVARPRGALSDKRVTINDRVADLLTAS